MMISPSTQSNIQIAGIKDGIVILKDGQYRIILDVTAINFDLKSEQEQNSLVFQYQSFLNSLHFPIEIVIQSKKLDLSPYLQKIQGLADKQTNDLIKMQTQDYVDFVGQLINLANIMKKKFYVVVGFQPVAVNSGVFDKIFSSKNTSTKLRISESDFESYSKDLRQRAQNVSQGLGAIGLHCRQLSTKEIIEVFYEIYNPELAGKERLVDPEQVSGSYVTQLKAADSQADINPDTGHSKSDEIIDNESLVIEQKKRASQQQLEAEPKPAAPAEETSALPGEQPPQAAKANETPTQAHPTQAPVAPVGETQVATPAQQLPDDPITQNNKNYGW